MEGAFAFPGSDDPLGVTGVGVRPGASTLWHSGARETEGGVRVPESREAFETYPYNPDAQNPVTGPQDPPPAAMQPRLAPPPQVGPPPDQSASIGRRLLLGFAAAAGVAVVGGTIVSAANRNGMPAQPWPVEVEPDPEVTTAPAEEEEEIEETTSAYLNLGDGESVHFDVPAGWQVDSEGDYLVVSHPGGRLVARMPEWSRASRNDLAREADYLRDGFDPTGEPIVFDNSTSRLTQFNQVTSGHFGGEPGTEEVMLLLDPSMEQAIAMWWATVDADTQAAVEARTMVADLRAGFVER